ncbi:molybdenum cofactor biosynthesis protein B [Pseudomonas sp. B21-028]|uniref:molybdenum cofactor biosynthesis protein B n=1 Tax=Pseudomonas sp. B21-028 TaxID=2895480 RepID=UPI00215E76EA|nr:molybdenum cofactor biosynthesis protein B [Pseudomonas sp. B21-028]UVL81640.1 molybdenum cofactor biosynthesis protein B [Pseudomonas sp. B21-028]
MAHLTQRQFQPLNIAVLTISDTRSFDTDTSGQTLVDLLQTAGHVLIDRGLVKDDIYQIRAQVSQWIADPTVQVVLMTGGTGFTARDNTPQAVAPLLDKQVDGFGELFRQVSLAEIGMSSLQSRALAGMSNGVLVCCLPGSPGACRTGWEQILAGQLDSRTGPCNFTPHLKPQADVVPVACETRS